MRSLFVVLLAGCAVPTTAEVEQEGGVPCSPDWGCNSNSPVMNTRRFHELHEGGRPNDAGFSITGFRLHGAEYELDVDNGRIHARRGATSIEGLDLEDAAISIAHHGIPSVVLRIHEITSVPYWIAGTTANVETYRLEWSEVAPGGGAAGNWRNLCNRPPVDDSDTYGMDSMHAVVFEGDRIDAIAKTVYGVDRDGEWFNIGCAGNALAKLALSGHTEAASHDGFVRTLDQRQTLLKLFVADYCGDGTPFTVGGQVVHWSDRDNWFEYPSASQKVEARWTPTGAACLERPRVGANPTDAGDLAFPDIETEISTHCKRPPPCSDIDPHSFAPDEHVISANPD